MADKHFHAYWAAAEGPAGRFCSRATDVFHSREAAQKWVEKQRPRERRFIRACTGGPACPGTAFLDTYSSEAGERPMLPLPQPRKKSPYVPVRVRRLRDAIDAMTPEQLQTLDDYIRLTMKATAA